MYFHGPGSVGYVAVSNSAAGSVVDGFAMGGMQFTRWYQKTRAGKGQKRPKSNTKDTYLSFTSEASPFAKQSTLQKPEFLNIMRCSVRRHSLPSDFGLMCLYSAVELQELAVASTPGETCEGQRFVNEEHWRQSSNLFSLPDSGRGESH
jgi:hypothetical protein